MGYLTQNFSLKFMLLLICSYHINLFISNAHLGSFYEFLSFSEFKVYVRNHFQSFFPLVSVIFDTLGIKHCHSFLLKLFV